MVQKRRFVAVVQLVGEETGTTRRCLSGVSLSAASLGGSRGGFLGHLPGELGLARELTHLAGVFSRADLFNMSQAVVRRNSSERRIRNASF